MPTTAASPIEPIHRAVETPSTDFCSISRALSVPSRLAQNRASCCLSGCNRIERTDADVISVRISERKLHSSSVWIHMWLFFQPADERARPCKRHLKVVDPEEQKEAVARLAVVRTCQRG